MYSLISQYVARYFSLYTQTRAEQKIIKMQESLDFVGIFYDGRVKNSENHRGFFRRETKKSKSISLKYN